MEAYDYSITDRDLGEGTFVVIHPDYRAGEAITMVTSTLGESVITEVGVFHASSLLTVDEVDDYPEWVTSDVEEQLELM